MCFIMYLSCIYTYIHLYKKEKNIYLYMNDYKVSI